MSHRSLVISDVHLGPGQGVQPDQLRPLWRDTGADELIVNGDLAEMHQPRYAADAGWQVLELQNLCQFDGVKLTLIAGNHDPYLADRRHLLCAGGQVLITHGDVLHPSIAPWCPTSNQVQREYFDTAAALAPASRMDLETKLAITAHAAYHSWQLHARHDKSKQVHTAWKLARHPIHALRLLHYWAIVPKLAARFAQLHTPEARFVLIGHTHLQGVWQKLGRTVINTGCYTLPGKPRAVMIESGKLTYHRLVQGAEGNYALVDAPVRTFELEPFDAEQERPAVITPAALKFPAA